jgi:hypothetical protein
MRANRQERQENSGGPQMKIRCTQMRNLSGKLVFGLKFSLGALGALGVLGGSFVFPPWVDLGM